MRSECAQKRAPASSTSVSVFVGARPLQRRCDAAPAAATTQRASPSTPIHRETKLAKSGKSKLQLDDKKIETLGQGEQIKLSIGGTGGRTKRTARLGGGGGLRKPGALSKPTQRAAAPAPGGDDDLLGGLSSAMAGASISAPAPAPAPAAGGADDWEPF